MAGNEDIMITVDMELAKALQDLQNLQKSITETQKSVQSNFNPAVNNTNSRLNNLGRRVSNLGATIKQKIGTEAALAFGAAGTGALAFAKKCVDSAIKSESAWTRYGALVDQGGGNWSKQSSEIKAWAKDFSNSMGYAVGDTREAMTALAEFGVKQSEMKTAMQGVAGVAARTGMTEAEASNMVISALNGRAMQLRKYTGLEIENYKAADGTIDRERLLNDLYNQNQDAIAAHGKTTEAQLQRMQNSWASLKTSIGNALMPVVKFIADIVTALSNWFTDMNKAHPIIAQIAAGVLAFGAAIGIGIGALGMIAGPLMNLGTMISAVSKAMKTFELATKMSTIATKAHALATTVWNGITKAATMAQAALNAVMNMNPISLVVIAVVALIAVLAYLYKNNEQVRNAINQLGNYLKGAFIAAWNAVKGAIQWVSDGFHNLVSTLQTVYTQLSQIVQNIVNVIRARFGVLITIVRTIFTIFNLIISGKMGAARALAGRLAGAIRQIIVTRFNAIIAKVRSIFTNIVNTIRSRLSNAVSAARQKAQQIYQGIYNKVTQIPQMVADEFNKIKDRIKTAINNAKQTAVTCITNLVNAVKSALGIASPGYVQRMVNWEFSSLPGIIGSQGVLAAETAARSATSIVRSWTNNMDSLTVPMEGLDERFNSLNPLEVVGRSMMGNLNVVGSNMSNPSMINPVSHAVNNSNTTNNNKTVEHYTHIENLTLDMNQLQGTEKERWYNMLSEISRGAPI